MNSALQHNTIVHLTQFYGELVLAEKLRADKAEVEVQLLKKQIEMLKRPVVTEERPAIAER